MALRAIEELAAQHARERDAGLAHDRLRKRLHGIVHTPPELAQLVLRVSDGLLRDHFGADRGVCDPDVLLLDPACGPGAFFAAALALAEMQPGGKVRGVGFDVDASALGQARELTRHTQAGELSFEHADALATGRVAARAAEHPGPLLVLGNPPWVSARTELSALDRARLEAFRCDERGRRLQERKLGVLSDAYVRFFALCAEIAQAHASGAVVALVSNASFLDGLMHRGMRAKLLAAFDAVRVLDLGGSALLGRRRDQRDDNVFGVRPAVAVTWLCRYPVRASRRARVTYARLFGSRAEKLQRLAASDARDLGFRALAPELPNAYFVPRPKRDRRYEAQPALSQWLPFQREGMQSNRDAAVVAADAESLLERLRAFVRGEPRPELAQALTALAHYDPARARRAVAAALERDPDGAEGLVVQRLAYRPFDERVFCPVTPLCHRPRAELASALSHAPAALISVRKDRGDLAWTHSAWEHSVVDNCYLSARSSCRARGFPLRTPAGESNLSPQLARELADSVGHEVDVEAFAHYALCILSAASYRTRWDAPLHQDYPRIPLPPGAREFRALAALGERLAQLHTGPWQAATAIPEPPARSRHRDLNISAEGVRLGDVVLLPLSAAAAALRIGHHRPLDLYLKARADRPLDRVALGAVLARAERLLQLEAALRDADREVARALPQALA